ncbi:MAG: methyltransferase [Hyphomicrobiales bacterium]|nr:methyltransferase [Hyphomicrobiales bacterium]
MRCAGTAASGSDPVTEAEPVPGEAIADRYAFVRENTRLISPPLVPEIALHLADDLSPLWRKGEEELAAIGLPSPYWAFAWAGGQALARYLLDNPEIVARQSVLDFGAGSGLGAIAAAKAGAIAVAAADTDGFAQAAIGANAAANGVEIELIGYDLLDEDGADHFDVVIAGDVFYEWPAAGAVARWLEKRLAAGAEVGIGDPDRYYLPKDRLLKLCEYSVPVTRALEDLSIKKSAVWRFDVTKIVDCGTAPNA